MNLILTDLIDLGKITNGDDRPLLSLVIRLLCMSRSWISVLYNWLFLSKGSILFEQDPLITILCCMYIVICHNAFFSLCLFKSRQGHHHHSHHRMVRQKEVHLLAARLAIAG